MGHDDETGGRVRDLWRRFGDWLGLDRSEPPDLLTVDPAEHFRRWDRNLPDRYLG